MRLLNAILILALLAASGCASYSSKVAHSRSLFEQGQYDSAIDELKKLAEKHDNDELLYLMDLGLAYHTAGKYDDAIKTFLAAETLANKVNYVSVSQEAGAVLLNDQVKPYKGEDFEKVLLNVYLAIDYTLLGQWDDALVECRKVDHKIDMLISEGKIEHDRNAFAKYLAATLFEARGEYNDALVDYRQLFKWIGNGFPYLGAPLLRVATKLGDSEEVSDYRPKFPQVKNYRLQKNEGEVVVLVEQGKAPLKVPSEQFNLIPVFRKRYYSSDFGWVTDQTGREVSRSYPLFDIEQTAIKELDDKLKLIIAKKVTGVVAKEAVAYGVQKATKSELLGAITSIALHATDQADTRSWTTLPARLQLVRFPVPAGRREIAMDLVTLSGSRVPAVKRWTVDVKPGQIVFLDYRTRD